MQTSLINTSRFGPLSFLSAAHLSLSRRRRRWRACCPDGATCAPKPSTGGPTLALSNTQTESWLSIRAICAHSRTACIPLKKCAMISHFVRGTPHVFVFAIRLVFLRVRSSSVTAMGRRVLIRRHSHIRARSTRNSRPGADPCSNVRGPSRTRRPL